MNLGLTVQDTLILSLKWLIHDHNDVFKEKIALALLCHLQDMYMSKATRYAEKDHTRFHIIFSGCMWSAEDMLASYDPGWIYLTKWAAAPKLLEDPTCT